MLYYSHILNKKDYSMEINIYINTKKIDTDYQKALEEYKKRISAWCNLNIIPTKSMGKVSIKKSAKTYVVCPGKETMTSPELADLINTLNVSGISCINFIVLTDSYSEPFTFNDTDTFNLSSFTLDPSLTAVVLSEQLYRAYTITHGITYHK